MKSVLQYIFSPSAEVSLSSLGFSLDLSHLRSAHVVVGILSYGNMFFPVFRTSVLPLSVCPMISICRCMSPNVMNSRETV